MELPARVVFTYSHSKGSFLTIFVPVLPANEDAHKLAYLSFHDETLKGEGERMP